jgi:D-alanyl-D-alanine dipeptidase
MRIPELRDQTGFREIIIVECGEPLVDMKDMHSKIHVHSMYHDWGIPTALDTVYVRQDVANHLIGVASNLPSHLHLLLWDGWRPVSVQQALFEGYVRILMVEHPKLSIEMLRYKALDFVSLPSKDPLHPSTHATGGAIDLTLCDRHGVPLNLGTAFDDFTSKANTRYLEDKSVDGETFDDKEVRYLRRLLFHAMTNEGFTNFPNEWWHYDFGNQWWAVMSSNRDKAKYSYIELPNTLSNVI